MRILGINLKDVIIVDNAACSFGFQIDNGVPILPFFDDQNDEELVHLMSYFETIIDSEDLRECNRVAFRLHEISN